MPSKALKDSLRRHLTQGSLEEIAEMALSRRTILGNLLALTFDPDPEIAWRAIEAQGMGAEALSGTSPSYAREHMRRLYWLITEESGGFLLRAPECMAECGARVPDLFRSHIPIAFHLLETLEEEDLEHFRPGAIWAIGRLIHHAREHLPTVLPLVVEALDRPDSQSRGMAVWCLGEVGETDALKARGDLLDDRGPVLIYRDRKVWETTVGELTAEVLGAGP